MSRHALKVARCGFADLLRSRWLVFYTLFFAVTGWALFSFGEDPSQAVVSVLSLVLLVIPLVSVVVALTHFHNSREFMELLLVQPVSRRSVFWGHYLGLAASLTLAWLAGILGPFLWSSLERAEDVAALATLLATGALLTLTFVGLALAVSLTANRLTALARAIALWLYFAVVYDGLVLIAAIAFQVYPLERPLIGLMLLNPIDLARILVLLRLDVAALMGYTGAVFEAFLGSGWGAALAAVVLLLWAAVPVLLAARAYVRKDF